MSHYHDDKPIKVSYCNEDWEPIHEARLTRSSRYGFDSYDTEAEMPPTAVADPYYVPLVRTVKDRNFEIGVFRAVALATIFLTHALWGFWATPVLIPTILGFYIAAKHHKRQGEEWDAYMKHSREYSEVTVNDASRAPLQAIADTITALPPHRREEVRPLWDSARTAAELLLTQPDSVRALEALTLRAEAVANFAQVEAELTLAEAEAKMLGAGDDLDLVRNLTEAKREGVASYRRAIESA